MHPKPDSYEDLMVLVKTLRESSLNALDGYARFEVSENPYLSSDSDLIDSWLKGSKLFKGAYDHSCVQLAYHGTYSDLVIRKICKQGFDPLRRRCQGLGPGEYFGTSPQTALEFAGATNTLIATLVVSSPVTRLRNMGRILIVNNPHNRSITFCLPIFTIKYFKAPPDPTPIFTPNLALTFDLESLTDVQHGLILKLEEPPSSNESAAVEA